MIKSRPALLRNLCLFGGFLFTFTAMQAQMDFATAHELNSFSADTASNNILLFTDQGTGQLTNGTAEIKIDPTIANQIDGKRIADMVNVAIQLKGASNGVYVSKKNKNTFVITELDNGTSNAVFSYEMIVRKGNSK